MMVLAIGDTLAGREDIYRDFLAVGDWNQFGGNVLELFGEGGGEEVDVEDDDVEDVEEDVEEDNVEDGIGGDWHRDEDIE